MGEIEQRSGGAWRPSPGSVPTCNSSRTRVSSRAARARAGSPTTTAEGRSYVEEHRDELGEPWAKLAEESARSAWSCAAS